MKNLWPWEIDEIGYSKHYQEIVINTVVGTLFLSPIIAYLSVYFNIVEYVANIELYPSSFEIFKQIIFLSIVFETLYYWSHRLLHTPWLYKNFHKRHHEYQVTVAIASIYNHPFDFALKNLIPTYIGFALLGQVHIITTYLWYIILSH